MKPAVKLAVLALAGALFANANASTVTIQTNFSGAGIQADAAAYQSVVDAALAAPVVAGYGTAVVGLYDGISNHSLFGLSNSNIAFKSTVNFGVSATEAGNWSLRAGVDFGGGGALFVDGVAYHSQSHDMWWNGSYGNPSQYLTTTLSLSAGNHTMTLYGLEGCCDGSQQAQFQFGNHDYVTFGANDGLIAAVPEADSYAMMLAGLGLLGLVARRKRQA